MFVGKNQFPASIAIVALLFAKTFAKIHKALPELRQKGKHVKPPLYEINFNFGNTAIG